MPADPRLARHEIALIKQMLARDDFKKDRIQSYFSRPDRTVNFGRISEQDIVRHSIDKEIPGDPKEFIRQQLHLQFKKLPMFFFAVKAGMSREQLVRLIENEPDTTPYTRDKLLQRARNTSPPPAESRRLCTDLILKMTAGDGIRVTPENAIGICKAIRAMTVPELSAFDVFQPLKMLLALYVEQPSPGLYSQLRLTATYVDDAINNPQLS